VRNGTAKLLTLFHPATGAVRVKEATRCTNRVLHPWRQEELAAILAALPPAAPGDPQARRAARAAWQAGLSQPITLPAALPPLRLLLALDNLAGHLTPSVVRWLFAHGIMPPYTPLGGSWLDIAESIQRVLKRRALAGTHPTTPEEIIGGLEGTARAWNAAPPAVSAPAGAAMPSAAPARRRTAPSGGAPPGRRNGDAHANRPRQARRWARLANRSSNCAA
jgi:hypothetical protein